MEAPLLVDIVHNSTGKHEKKAVVQAVKHLNWTGFINFDITILLGKLYFIQTNTQSGFLTWEGLATGLGVTFSEMKKKGLFYYMFNNNDVDTRDSGV